MRLEKPEFLSAEQASAFEDLDVVASYRNRPPYSDAVFDALIDLTHESGPILDIGCGTGFIARPLAQRGLVVDASDISKAMVERGRKLPGGDLDNLRWEAVAFEESRLTGPYSLIVAGESLHWMDWQSVLPKCHRLLAPGRQLAVVDNRALPPPWQDELIAIISRYSTSQRYRPYDTANELAARGLFREEGRVKTAPDPIRQSIDDYIDSFHARASFARVDLGPNAQAFDDAVRQAVTRTSAKEVVIERVTEIVWGTPLPSSR